MNTHNKIGPTFWDEIEKAGLFGLPFSINMDTGEVYNSGITDEQYTKLLSVIAAHDPTKTVIIVPDNPTLGDWRVALALWKTTDANGNATTWLNILNSTVKSLVDSGNPMGQVILQRLEYSNNVKRQELIQLMEYFTFDEAKVDESLQRAYLVSLGDLRGIYPLPSK